MMSKKVVLPLVFSLLLSSFLLCIVVVMTISRENQVGDDFIGGEDGEYETVGIAPEVERCRAVFEKYARQEGVFDYYGAHRAGKWWAFFRYYARFREYRLIS